MSPHAATTPGAPTCPVCDARGARLRYELPPLRVWTCTTCTITFLWPLATEEEIRALFEELYTTGEALVPELRNYYAFCYDDTPANPLVVLYEHWLERLERLRPPGRLLDIGCGTGLFLAVARRRGWTPFGIDDCAPATRHARERFGLAVETADFESFAWGDTTFDAITMWDIIEHARRPVALLEAVRRRLAPGGVVAIATPNQHNILDVLAGLAYRATGGRVTSPLRRLYLLPHFLYFTGPTLAGTLARAGLTTLHVERELTDLRRLTLGPAMRAAVWSAFRIARMTGLENRLLAFAARSADRPS